jgi:hypothetical protein
MNFYSTGRLEEQVNSLPPVTSFSDNVSFDHSIDLNTFAFIFHSGGYKKYVFRELIKDVK